MSFLVVFATVVSAAASARVVDGSVVGRRTHVGSNVPLTAWAPEGLKENAAVYVLLEFAGDKGPLKEKLENQMASGVIPPGVVICTNPGVLYPTQSTGKTQYMRALEYDRIGRDFPDFIVDELIPYAALKLQVKLDPSPERHFIAGCSSGGLAAWNVAWHRNDYFRRVFLSSPTFSAIAGGEEPMTIMRKCEPRPIRIFMTCGSQEPDYYFGNSYYVARNAEASFAYAGYDCRFEIFPHEGHGARRQDPALWDRMMPWLFEGWQKGAQAKVTLKHSRLKGLLAEGSSWEEVATNLPPPKTSVKSVDAWRLFSVAPDERSIVSRSILKDGSLGGAYRFGPFHLSWDAKAVGARALAVLADGRLLAATDLGIQAAVPFGIVDAIVPLPRDLPCDNLTVVGNTLYAASGNHVFRRALKLAAADPSHPARQTTPEYWDGKMLCPEHIK